MPHPFFDAINKDQELSPHCRIDITNLPEAHKPDSFKAIVLGADPTNKGIQSNPGLIQLKKVFGIDSIYEKYFWSPQMNNLKAIGLTKDKVYVQNVCRNYFATETYKNKFWIEIARKYWLKYLKEELDEFEIQIPILATTEIICKLLVGNKIPAAKVIYDSKEFTPFYSEYLQREVYPLYRNFNYALTTDKWQYKNTLTNKFNNG